MSLIKPGRVRLTNRLFNEIAARTTRKDFLNGPGLKMAYAILVDGLSPTDAAVLHLGEKKRQQAYSAAETILSYYIPEQDLGLTVLCEIEVPAQVSALFEELSAVLCFKYEGKEPEVSLLLNEVIQKLREN